MKCPYCGNELYSEYNLTYCTNDDCCYMEENDMCDGCISDECGTCLYY